MTSDGTGLVFNIPAAEVQANASGWEEFIAWGFGAALGYGLRGACIALLTASGVGAALIPLICTPLGGAVAGFAKGMLEACFDTDFQSVSFWSNLIISTVGGAVGGFAWEKWISPFFKGSGVAAAGRLGTWLQGQAPGIASWFGAAAGPPWKSSARSGSDWKIPSRYQRPITTPPCLPRAPCPGIAQNGEPEGMYMVASGTHVNDGCCFDFGNAEKNNDDNLAGHMPAISGAWQTQNLTSVAKTPAAAFGSPVALVHYDTNGGLTWISVFTVNGNGQDLDETYLSNVGFPGDPWATQDLTSMTKGPAV